MDSCNNNAVIRSYKLPPSTKSLSHTLTCTVIALLTNPSDHCTPFLAAIQFTLLFNGFISFLAALDPLGTITSSHRFQQLAALSQQSVGTILPFFRDSFCQHSVPSGETIECFPRCSVLFVGSSYMQTGYSRTYNQLPSEPDLPFSPQETSSSATYRGSQEEPVLSPSYSSQGSVDGSCTCRCLSSFCRDPCIWTERSPSSANIPIGDIERTARFSCPCNFASLFHSFCLWCVCWSISSSFNSLLSIHPFPLRYSSSLSQSKETPKPASIPFPRLRCTTFAPLSERRIGVFFRIHCRNA